MIYLTVSRYKRYSNRVLEIIALPLVGYVSTLLFALNKNSLLIDVDNDELLDMKLSVVLTSY